MKPDFQERVVPKAMRTRNAFPGMEHVQYCSTELRQSCFQQKQVSFPFITSISSTTSHPSSFRKLAARRSRLQLVLVTTNSFLKTRWLTWQAMSEDAKHGYFVRTESPSSSMH